MPAVAWGQGKQDFTLINKTGYALSELYVSPNDEEDWQEDVLGKDVLDDGQSADIAFDRSSKACHWDLMVVYEDDGPRAVWRTEEHTENPSHQCATRMPSSARTPNTK